MLHEVGTTFGNDRVPDATVEASAATAASDAVHRRGGAVVGDKTMVDALAPFVAALQSGARAAETATVALREVAAAAKQGAERSAALMPGLGRARTHGERAVGTPDAGAVSLALIAEVLAMTE